MTMNNTSSIELVNELNQKLTITVLPVTIFIGVETVVGLVGNVMILLIYGKRYERSNFRYFVLSMAVIDLTSCLTTLPGEMFSQLNWYTYKYDWICRVKSYFNVYTAWGSASILLLLAFDRHRKVCRPLRWQIQPHMAKKLSVLAMFVSAVVAVPVAFLWGRQTYAFEYDGRNVNVSICEKSQQYGNNNYPLIYIASVYILPVTLMMFVMAVFNVLTARKLFGSQKMLAQLCQQEVHGSTSSLASSSMSTETHSVCSEASSTPLKGKANVHKNASTTESCHGGNISSSAIGSKRFKLRTSVSTISLPTLPDAVSSRQRISVGIKIERSSANKTKAAVLSSVRDRNSASDKTVAVQRGSKLTVTSTNSTASTSPLTNDVRRKHKTVIMLVLSIMFIMTMSMYVILVSFVASTESILRNLEDTKKATFFFFWRLYFINTVINPVLYGFLDPRFRVGLMDLLRCRIFLKRYRSQNGKRGGEEHSDRGRPVFTLN